MGKIGSFLLIFFLLILISCNQSGSKKDNHIPKSDELPNPIAEDEIELIDIRDLVGTWIGKCQNLSRSEDELLSLRIDIKFNLENKWTYTENYFWSEDCSTDIEYKKIFLYKMSFSGNINKTIQKMDLVLDKVKLSILNDALIDMANAYSSCSHSNWIKGFEYEATGMACTMFDVLPAKGKKLFDIIFFMDDELFLGDKQRGEPVSADLRPSRFETIPFTKEHN